MITFLFSNSRAKLQHGKYDHHCSVGGNDSCYNTYFEVCCPIKEGG